MTAALLEDINLPTLIIIRGVPGGGKSYLATSIQQVLGIDTVVLVDPDITDYTSEAYTTFSQNLLNDGVDVKFHPYRFNRSNAHQAITNKQIVIWNQAFIDFDGLQKTVINLQSFAAEQNLKLPVLIVEVEIGNTIASQRIADRVSSGGHNVPAEALNRFIDTYHSFAGKEYATVTVNGTDDINTSVAAVVQNLKQL